MILRQLDGNAIAYGGGNCLILLWRESLSNSVHELCCQTAGAIFPFVLLFHAFPALPPSKILDVIDGSRKD